MCPKYKANHFFESKYKANLKSKQTHHQMCINMKGRWLCFLLESCISSLDMPPRSSSCSHIITLYLICLPLSYSIEFNYQAVFNFGDSNSDTGGLIAGVGEHLYPPNGHTYFKNPSGRFCNGRLIIDFLSK